MAQGRGHEASTNASTLEIAVSYLERLANDLDEGGWKVVLTVPKGEWPRVHVTNPYMRALNEDVIAAPDAAGNLWFWWSWAEPIGRVTDIARVLARISHVLVASGEQ